MEKKRNFFGEITGWGIYTPPKVVTNSDMAKVWDTSDEWIVQRTGIQERRFTSKEETTASMAIEASLSALQKANLNAQQLDLIIVGTCLAEDFTPSVACLVQAGISAKHIPAFDISAGCSGFLYSITTAFQFIQTGAYKRILVIGVEHLTRFFEKSDRSFAVLFGDGAGAVVIEQTTEPSGLMGFTLGAKGDDADAIVLNTSSRKEQFDEGHFVDFKGRKVFKFASRILGKACREALSQAQLTFDDVDWIIPHQANVRIIESAAREMGIPIDKFVINIQNYGNTSSASIPIALFEGLESGKIKRDDTVLMVGFGAGLTWGASLIKLAPSVIQTPILKPHDTQNERFAVGANI